MRDDQALLLDMLIAARKVRQFTYTETLSEFQHDEMAQSAVLRELQVIGEAARLVSDDTKAQIPNVDWRTIAGMRNRLVHEYFAVSIDIVWQTAQEDIPTLIETLERLVPQESNLGANAGGKPGDQKSSH